jgi:hypothetical protein
MPVCVFYISLVCGCQSKDVVNDPCIIAWIWTAMFIFYIIDGVQMVIRIYIAIVYIRWIFCFQSHKIALL